MNETAGDTEHRLALYNQNSEHFRGLNSQMWQIPIIGMTLTGGLWFGVSNVKDSPLFQIGLLLLATAGNIALILVLFRLRFVMGAYLKWLNENEPAGKIDADGNRFYEKSFFVRTVFQIVLALAAVTSLVLLVNVAANCKDDKPDTESRASYYHSYETVLGDENEVPRFAGAHPQLTSLVAHDYRLTRPQHRLGRDPRFAAMGR